MGVTNFPGGITSFGIPVMGGGQLPALLGNIFFVSSVLGSDGYEGTSERPLATIHAAIVKCTADNGDLIVVLPGHAENISSATSLVVDVAGVTIIGLGAGHSRPALTFTATAGSIELDAARCRFSNMRLIAGIAAVVVGVNVDADDIEVDHCEFDISATGYEFLLMMDIDAFDRANVHDNVFAAENIAGCNTGIRLDDTIGVRIVSNEFRGDFTTAAISGTTGSAAASVDTLIARNLIENRDTTAGILLDAHDSGTGLLAYNAGFTLYATDPESTIDPGNLLCIENYVVNAVDESGTIVPTILST